MVKRDTLDMLVLSAVSNGCLAGKALSSISNMGDLQRLSP